MTASKLGKPQKSTPRFTDRMGGVHSKNYRFVIAGLLFSVGTINYMDRAALGVAAPFVKTDLGLSPSELGLIFSTFFLGYSLFAFVGGHLADRYGPKRVFVWAALSWSILSALTGAVAGFAQLLVVRTLFGFSEGPMNSTANKTISNWFPRKETSRTVGIVFSGQSVGSALAAPVVGLLMISVGWRTAFVITGAAGVLWVVAWSLLMTDHPRGRTGARAGDAMASEGPAPVATLPLRAYLGQPAILALGLGLFAMNYPFYILLSWLPTYLTHTLHIPVKTMVFVAAIPWACGMVGYLGGGTLSDYLYRRLPDPLFARKISTTVPLALAVVVLLALSVSSGAVMAVSLITTIIMLMTAAAQACWATVRELVPTARVGGVSGFVGMISNISGIIGPAVTGFTVQYFGGFNSAFVVAAVIALVGALAMAMFVNRQGIRLGGVALAEHGAA
jgi:ACS family hexuronate transporter-like MFS transporter